MTRISIVDPQRASSLASARLALHWAAQIPAAAGATLLEPAEDDSHTALTYAPTRHALLGQPLTDGGLRAGLRLGDVSLLVVERDEEVSSLPLTGRTLDEGLSWLGETLSLRGTAATALRRPDLDLPKHPFGHGAKLTPGAPEDRRLLAEWFAGGHAVLSRVAEARDDASSVRCWPHHFDIATLITLEGGADDDRTVGVGMTPGDDSYELPYLYVTPWPYPSDDVELPELPHGGRWHTDGWTGAVLVGSELPADIEGAVTRFLEVAIDAAEKLAGA